MRVNGIHHLALKARDPERVAAFYRDVLGLVPKDRHEDARGLRSVWLDTGAAILMVERAEDDAQPPIEFDVDSPGFHLLALRISASERDAWRARLTEAGHPIKSETAFTLYVADPEGNRVGLSSWPKRGSES